MITKAFIKRYNTLVPRYTSYPPASTWKKCDSTAYIQALPAIASPISLYIHIPFCPAICLYCGCSSIPLHNKEQIKKYIQTLCQEVTLIQTLIGKTSIHQIHLGGGSPSLLSKSALEQIFSSIKSHFHIEENAEISIEIDPRNVYQTKKLETFKNIGFNRISLGIQDLNDTVQTAIGRYQSEKVSKAVFLQAKRLGFSSINVDLIYGLPCQTAITFTSTIKKIAALHPDRIALFSFAYLPEIKPHQRKIQKDLLPTPEEKFHLYHDAKNNLLSYGYKTIGIDHFAAPSDPLFTHLKNKTLRRTFQGYTSVPSTTLIGLGITSITSLEADYFQNTKDLNTYYKMIANKTPATSRGITLSHDDMTRRWVIEQILCFGSIDKNRFNQRWGLCFDRYFEKELALLTPLIEDGLVEISTASIHATKLGSFFLRNIASCFDTYTHTICSRAI